ncbi:MAG: hydrogenase maturation nickel metallochaperone HypA [Bifidobacteriaceae bacterium]|nr:hydrogenase maturation nickel metallochaperone HypA [Bifidobacteriaceae bacterium]
MHELSLCRSIYGITVRAAGDRPVARVCLDIGQLRQVVPATLARCWEVVTATTALEGSVLVVNHIAARAVCQDCGAGLALGPTPAMVCGTCGGRTLRIEAGEEFLVRSIDVAAGSGSPGATESSGRP